MKRRSGARSVDQDEYGWVNSILRERGHGGSSREGDDESLGIAMESDILRTALFTFLLGALACLIIYFSYRVATGEGRRVFLMMVSLAAFMACGAVAARGRILVRLICALAAVGALALLVDQLVYYRWHKRVDRVMTSLRESIESGAPVLPGSITLRPTSFRVEPGREVVLQFEPSALAWTYHLDAASRLGHMLVWDWYRLLSKVTRGRSLDRVARTFVRPHQVYVFSVVSPDRDVSACLAVDRSRLAMSIDTWRGYRPEPPIDPGSP